MMGSAEMDGTCGSAAAGASVAAAGISVAGAAAPPQLDIKKPARKITMKDFRDIKYPFRRNDRQVENKNIPLNQKPASH
jgi:hypothetical protein